MQADGTEGTVKRFLEDFDVALIELPTGRKVEITGLGGAIVMEEACLINETHSIPCRVTRAGTSLLFLQFPCFDMPQPGIAVAHRAEGKGRRDYILGDAE